MTVTNIGGQHVYQCDLCGSWSGVLELLDLHRIVLDGPDDPDVEGPGGDVVLDVCYDCRDQIKHSNSEARVEEIGDDDVLGEVDPSKLNN